MRENEKNEAQTWWKLQEHASCKPDDDGDPQHWLSVGTSLSTHNYRVPRHVHGLSLGAGSRWRQGLLIGGSAVPG